MSEKKKIDLNSEDAYYIYHERGNFGTYPREINAKGRTHEEVVKYLQETYPHHGVNTWDVSEVYIRDEAYHEYKRNIAHVQRTSSAFW